MRSSTTIKPIITVATTVLLLGSFGTTNALSIVLSPSAVEVDVGDTISLDLIADFSDDPTIGGGVDIKFDSTSLQFESWVAAGLGIPDFVREPDLSDGHLSGIAFGDFGGVSGGLIGTVTFSVVGGSSSITVGDTQSLAGPFVSATTFQAQVVDFGGTRVNLFQIDGDNDGVLDSADNCLIVPNAAQRDTDMDGIGNVCDPDLNNNCNVFFDDLNLLEAAFFSTEENSDFNGDGFVNFIDMGVMRSMLYQPPGPSGTANICIRGN